MPALHSYMLPNRIAQYRITAKLGEGGMGVVYRAEDEALNRQVAIKLISGAFMQDPQAIKRFAREVEIASGLHHPHICTVYECAELDCQPYMVMELLEGQTLRDTLDGRPLPIARILDLGIEIADALHDAHEHGIVHRDVNSTNIFITHQGAAKVLDFGLAKICGREPLGLPTQLRPASDVSSPGLAIGTASTMSPEQVSGQDLDHRSDLFSVGILLYEMATGMRPFIGATNALVMHAILYRLPTEASRINPRIPREFDHIVEKALQKDRAYRYNTAHELKEDLIRLR